LRSRNESDGYRVEIRFQTSQVEMASQGQLSAMPEAERNSMLATYSPPPHQMRSQDLVGLFAIGVLLSAGPLGGFSGGPQTAEDRRRQWEDDAIEHMREQNEQRWSRPN
jgi:hypothetical protein